MQALPNHVLMMQIDCEVINTGLVHIKEDAIPIHLSSRMRSEPGPASPSSAAASNSSLQHNDSQKPYDNQFGGYQNDISGPPERRDIDLKPEAVIRVNVENEIIHESKFVIPNLIFTCKGSSINDVTQFRAILNPFTPPSPHRDVFIT